LSLLNPKLKIQNKLSFRTSADSDKTDYSLKGIIYHGQYHFTSRLIDNAGGIWYHDGMTSGRECVYEGKWKDIQDIYQASGERHQSSFIFPPRCIAKKATEYSTVNTVPSELFIVTDSIRRVLVTSMVPLASTN